MDSKEKIFVTKPTLPNLDDFTEHLSKIWESGSLTNCGTFHQQLEENLAQFLGVKYVSLFNNGTIALLAALKQQQLKGEVITTPYTFLATAHSVLWNGLKPVFVDIEEDGFNICPKEIEKAITPRTSAILPVHCYGIPCNYKEIERVAKENSLKVVYDAAHSFGTSDENGSILNHGDLSILSFHATKVFNTFEGGAIISHDLDTKREIDQLRNFGLEASGDCKELGINGKLSEIHSIMGMLQLNSFSENTKKREVINQIYRESLAHINGIKLPRITKHLIHNYSYFPLEVEKSFSLTRDELFDVFTTKDIIPRKYFYPLVSSMELYSKYNSGNYKFAQNASNQIICLPIFPDMLPETAHQITNIIKEYSK